MSKLDKQLAVLVLLGFIVIFSSFAVAELLIDITGVIP